MTGSRRLVLAESAIQHLVGVLRLLTRWMHKYAMVYPLSFPILILSMVLLFKYLIVKENISYFIYLQRFSRLITNRDNPFYWRRIKSVSVCRQCQDVAITSLVHLSQRLKRGSRLFNPYISYPEKRFWIGTKDHYINT